MPPPAPPLDRAARPPPAPGPAGEALYQHLYAGEYGEGAQASGDRARMLAWLASLDPSREELLALQDLVALNQRLQAEARAETETLGAREAALLNPIYAELLGLYARPAPPTEAELAPLAARLEQARAKVEEGIDPHGARFDRVVELFEACAALVRSLPEDRRRALGEARFFLGRKLGPFSTPGEGAALLGSTWEALDFAALKVDPRDATEGHMDIGGLWAAERVRGGQSDSLLENQLATILMVASAMEGLNQAIEVRLGQRAALDFNPQPVGLD